MSGLDKLSGREARQLQQTLLNAYDPNSLAQMVRFELDEYFEQIVGEGNFADKIFSLITWAERQGRLRDLLEAAVASNAQHPQLNELVNSLLRKQTAPAAAPTPASQLPQTPFDMEWCHVPAGPFYMGSTPQQIEIAYQSAVKKNSAFKREWFERERSQHLLFLEDYFIAHTPVTNAQFARFVSTTGYRTTAEKEGSAWGYSDGKYQNIKGANWQHPNGPDSSVKMDHPVVSVSWHDAVAFCQWADVQLPSEAQWEKAARGTDGQIYPWGNEPPTDNLCNFNMNVGTTTPVGSYLDSASPYGCLDMAGNVWEWTSSLLKEYPYNPTDGREDVEADGNRTCRGGSFYYNVDNVRCAYRSGFSPTFRNYLLGFRILSPGAVGR